MSFEEEYEDVLQNIEFGIVSVYRQNPELVDYDVEKALSTLSRAYRYGEAPPPPDQFTDLQKLVYMRVKAMCDWRLGKAELEREDGVPVDMQPAPVTPDEIVACLRRIQKSVQRWTSQGGRQGYLTFINEYIL